MDRRQRVRKRVSRTDTEALTQFTGTFLLGSRSCSARLRNV